MVARSYHSALRAKQFALTVHRVLQEALPQFEQLGYGGVRIKEVAEKAGVAQATVYERFTSKAGLLLAVLREFWEDPAAEEDEAPADDVATDTLEAWLDGQVEAFARGRALLRAAAEARDVPDVAAYLAARDLQRRLGLQRRAAAMMGSARAGVRPATDNLVDVVAWLLSAESYLHFVDARGWPNEVYRQVLDEVVARLLAER